MLEGPDGAGKSTLAQTIAKEKKASVIHSNFDPTWDIQQHHADVIEAVKLIEPWGTVVMDRWALSEYVYGTVFRGKPAYDVLEFMDTNLKGLLEVTYIYCRNDHVIENHARNKAIRHEQFDDMENVLKLYDEYIAADTEHSWITYDYYKVKMKDFVKELPGINYSIPREEVLSESDASLNHA